MFAMRSTLRAWKGVVLSMSLALLVPGGCPATDPAAMDFDVSGDQVVDQVPGDVAADPADTDGTPDAGSEPDAGGDPVTVDDSLNTLGIDTTPTARVDEAETPLPEDYSPLGSSCTVAETDELFVLGPQLLDPVPLVSQPALDNRAVLLELSDDLTGDVGVNLTRLFEPGTPWEADAGSSHPGANGNGTSSQTTRTAVAADVDRDGQEELVIARFEPGDPNAFVDLLLTIVDSPEKQSAAKDFTQPERRVLARRNLRDVALAAADLDGDGDDDIVLGLATRDAAELLALELNDAGVFEVPDQPIATFARKIDGALSLELAAGNLDFDNPAEIVAVVNEFGQGGRSRYWVFDDVFTAHAVMADDRALRIDDGATYEAVVADVAVGDFDGDARDEIFLAGLTDLATRTCEPTGHVYLALEDLAAEAPLAEVGGEYYRYNYVPTGNGCDEVAFNLRIRHVFVNALDIDGDGLAEVQANLRVFDDWQAGPLKEIHRLPDDETLQLDAGRRMGGAWSRATVAMATGDVNGDGRDDILSYAQWRGEVSVWGIEGPSVESASFRRIVSIPTQRGNSQTRIYPVLVPADMDSDGLALKYSAGRYRLVFTEPIIMAALAAAPCVDGIDQNFDECRTSYGVSSAQSGGIDGTVSVRASTWVGGETKIFGIGASVRETVTTTASFSAGRSYQLEQTVEYTTGPREDTVIATVLPVDQYSYDVVSHPDPNMVGRTVVVNLPRTPITLQIERAFYNESTPAGAFKVGRNVFLHTPGDPQTYPTEGDADALIDTGGLGHLGPLGELVDAAGAALGPIAERLLGRGLKSDRAVGVGASGGSSEIEIRFSESTDYRAGSEISYDLEAETTAGFVLGGSVGGSLEAGLSWGSTSTTIYRGSVGDIAPADFPENGFSYGIFTYIYNYGDRSQPQFEVINYWVE